MTLEDYVLSEKFISRFKESIFSFQLVRDYTSSDLLLMFETESVGMAIKDRIYVVDGKKYVVTDYIEIPNIKQKYLH